MRLHVISDIHLEFGPWCDAWAIDTIDCDVHVLAGDIGVGLKGIEWALKTFTKPVIYVFGNHEYYDQSMIKLMAEARKRVAGTHVHLLENDSVVLQGRDGDHVRFIGATLWTDFCNFGPQNQANVMRRIHFMMNDYQCISVTRHEHQDLLTPGKSLALHNESRGFIERQLASPRGAGEKTVVVTHHSPTLQHLAYDWGDGLKDNAYASNLDSLVAQADLWIHGHTHNAWDRDIEGGGRVVTNCRGYQNTGPYSVPDFQWNRVVLPERTTRDTDERAKKPSGKRR